MLPFFLFALLSSSRNRNDLAEVVALLKTQIDPELLKKEQENMAEAEEKKENTGGKSWQGSRVDVMCAGVHPGDAR